MLLSAVVAFSTGAENIVRNGNFMHGPSYNGSAMRIGKFDVGNRIRETQKNSGWHAAPFEGWWLFAEKGMDAQIEDAGNMLAMSGHGVLYSDPRPFEGESATLSFDVQTTDAGGTVSLDLLKRDGDRFQRLVSAMEKIVLPENTNGKFIRLSVTAKGTGSLLASLKLALERGTVVLDNVQIEAGETVSAFRPRPGEWLELAVDDFPKEDLPRYYADGGKGKPAGARMLTVTNRSGAPLSGTLNVYLDRWNEAGRTLLKSFALQSLAPNEHVSVPFEPGKLPNDAWIVLAELLRDGKTVVGKDIFQSKNTGNGRIGEHMLDAYNGMCLCVFPPVAPAETFGVGNGMVGIGQWWSGVELRNAVLAREANLVGLGPMSAPYRCAVAGAQSFEGTWIDAASENSARNNPATRNALDIFNPDAKEELKERAEKIGRTLATGPGVNGFKLRNESPYFNGGVICPTPSADAAFREWCRNRYGTLDILNRHWGTSYRSWDEVEQIVSARMAGKHSAQEKQGAAAIDWYANLGRIGDEVVSLMKRNPGRAMDWNRWRTAASLELYGNFIDEIRRYDQETLIGNNFCWPNFWPQIAMPFYRKSGIAMLDLQYAAGHGVDLGNSDEMIDILEMAESTVPGKPIWGIEVYVQPSFPDDFPALQNWGLLAHGMTNNLVFAWEPYSDHGPKAFASGPGSWKLPGAKPMWFLIDTDGSKLPLWYSNLKSAKEIAAFHQKFDGLGLKRLNSRTGWYLPDDTSEFAILMTGNKPYSSKLVHSRVTTAAQLRMNGVTLNYLDDFRIPSMTVEHCDTILLPPSPVLTDAAASQLAAFVKSGGTLVLLGPCGGYDPWLNRRATFGGPAWSELGWLVPKHWKDIESFMNNFNTPSPDGLTSCEEFPPLPGAEILRGPDGREFARVRKWGKGRLIAATVYPNRYTSLTHAPGVLSGYMKWLIETANLKSNGNWIPDRENTPEDLKSRIGHGSPIVEVVVREKSPEERFVFILNQGGSGGGTIRIPVVSSSVKVENALTGEVIPGKIEDGAWQCHLDLAPWQYLVVRMVSEPASAPVRN